MTFNAVGCIGRTLDSLISLNKDDFELIVIDGQSSDETVRVVKGYNLCDKILVEKDHGIYDAMNKGIKMAEGDYCMFLNAGDAIYNYDVLQKSYEIINDKKADVYFGDAVYVKDGLKETYFSPQLVRLPFRFCHQAMFFKTSLLKEFLYNDSYRFSGDSELVYRLFEAKKSIERLNFPIVKELAGEGTTERHLLESTRELYSIPYLKNNLSSNRIRYNKAKIALYCFLTKLREK